MKKYAGQPFLLVGINADDDAETLGDSLARSPMPWPTIWDGPAGPLAAQFGVQAYPSLYLLDAAGRIRRSWTGMPHPGELDAAIEALLAEGR